MHLPHQPHGRNKICRRGETSNINSAGPSDWQSDMISPAAPKMKMAHGNWGNAPRSYVRLPKGSGRSGRCCFLQLLVAIWRLPVCLTQVWRVHDARNGYTTRRGRHYTSHKWTWTARHTTFDVDVGAIDPCVSIHLYTMFIYVLLLFKSHNKLRISPAQGQRSPPYGSVAQNHAEPVFMPLRMSGLTILAMQKQQEDLGSISQAF